MASGNTNTYFHHVPGRLRVRSSLVKGNERQASSAKAWLHSLPGVLSAEANTLTGSLTLRYDTSLTHGDTLLAALKQAGYVSTPLEGRSGPVFNSPSAFQTDLATKVAKTLAVYAVEQAVTALITALL
jgi:hypothetical protein